MAKKSGGGKKTRKAPSKGTSPQITSEEALKFIRRLQKKFPVPPRTRKQKRELQEYLEKFTDTQLKAVGSRVQSDLMLRPPRTIESTDYPTPKRPRRRPK
jgi:hypothetical protein